MIAEYIIDILYDIDLQLLQDDLKVIDDEFDKNGKLSFMFKHFKCKQTFYIFEEIKLNNRPLREGHDIKLLLNYLKCRDEKSRLFLKWNNIN